MTGMVRFWFVRHAPVVNPQGGIYGRMDLDCDTSDTPRFQVLADQLPASADWLISPLRRTAQTATALAVRMTKQPPTPRVDPALIEQDFGAWQGRSYDQVAVDFPDHNRRFWLAPAHEAPPEGESFAAVCQRVSEWLDGPGVADGVRDVVAVCHGGPIRAAVAHALALDPETALRLQVDTVSLTRIDRFPDGAWSINRINQTYG